MWIQEIYASKATEFVNERVLKVEVRVGFNSFEASPNQVLSLSEQVSNM